jgi:hypothetical protein
MLVKILSFGTNWWARFGRDPRDPWRFTRHAAYYNSTGVRCARKVRRHWIVSGLIRFDGVSDFNPHLPNRSREKRHGHLGGVPSVFASFICGPLTDWLVVLCPCYARVLTRLCCCHSMDLDHLGRPQDV